MLINCSEIFYRYTPAMAMIVITIALIYIFYFDRTAVVCGESWLLDDQRNCTAESFYSYGNICQTMARTFSHSSLNEPDYFGDLFSCLGLAEGDHPKVEKCTGGVNWWWFTSHIPPTLPMWSPSYSPIHDQEVEVDCQYKIEPQKFHRMTIGGNKHAHQQQGHRLEYVFRITQSGCTKSCASLGGSTFEVFGLTTLFVTSCNIIEHFNNTYDIICGFEFDETLATEYPQLTEKHGQPSNCLQLTVLLSYECFMGFHDLTRQAIPSQKILVDNETFCMDMTSATTGFNPRYSKLDTTPMATIPRLNWYDIHWMRASETDNARYSSGLTLSSAASFGNTTIFSAYEYKNHTNRLGDYSQIGRPIHQLGRMPPGAPGMNYYTDGRIVRKSVVKSHDGDGIHIQVTPLPTQPSASSSYFNHLDRDYYLLGSSHMRYFYNSLVTYSFGQESIESLFRKHGDTNIFQTHFARIVLADDVADHIHETCNSLELQNQRKVFLVQTGAWDLTHSTLRRAMHDAGKGLSPLVRKLREILIGGPRNCSGLTHVVLLTSNPYPLCSNDYLGGAMGSHFPVGYCEAHRYFRNNAAIAAFNTVFIGSLLHELVIHEDVQLSIIDAYAFIHPRLVFGEDSEVVCANHFVCNIEWWDDKHNASIVYTPGGLAISRAIIDALFR